MPSVEDIIRVIEDMAPANLALPDDPVGLQVGSPGWRVEKIMVSLDADTEVIGQAVKAGADLLLSHHPLLYRPLSRVDPDSPAGSAVALALENHLAVYCAHTNLDAADGGLNHILADVLGLSDRRPLEGISGDKFKMVVYMPGDSLDKVRRAAFESGAGSIGAYSMCSFAGPGTGTFLGSGDANPAVGNTGIFEVVDEMRLEMIVEADRVSRTQEAVRHSHPYEEPVIDLFQLHEVSPAGGVGLVGSLPKAAAISEIIDMLTAALGITTVFLISSGVRKAGKVAVCTGSGASLAVRAKAAGADVYVTGDVKYHQARDAQAMDLPLIDIGHFAPEKFGMIETGKLLQKALKRAGVEVEIVYSKEKDPFEVVIRA